MTVIARSEDEIVAEVMDAMPQMKGWREAELGWRVWTQDAIRRALALTADRGAVGRIEAALRGVEALRRGSGGTEDDPHTGDAWFRAQIVAYRTALEALGGSRR